MRTYAIVALLALATATSSLAEGPVVLTKDNFDAEVTDSGKNGFVKFLAPWCGHCKRMKPDWDKLGMEFKDSSSVVIGDADCTVETELCSDHGVKGYPTIKYYVDGEEKDYQGGRDFASLKKFVDTELAQPCDINDTENCDERQIKYINKMKAKGPADIAKQLARLQGMKGKSMKPELKQWLLKRLAILKQFSNSEL